MQQILIREYQEKDFPKIHHIYQQGIDTGLATFESKAKDQREWEYWLISGSKLVAILDEELVGWIGLSKSSPRDVYGGVTEVSVYVSSSAQGLGIASSLMQRVIDWSESNGIWTIQAGIFPSNEASLNLHLKYGFRKIGYREKVGQLEGVWHDTILLERRSKIVGV